MWVEAKLMESYTGRAWYIVVYCSTALKCLARFSALPAAAALPGTDAMVYPVLRSLMLSHSMVCCEQEALLLALHTELVNQGEHKQ